MDWIFSTEAWAALFTLTFLEVVLGIDNIIFIAILVGRVPKPMQKFARIAGLSLAAVTRILLLFTLSALMKLQQPLFTIAANSFSGKDLVLMLGGLFLLVKATLEIHNATELISTTANSKRKASASHQRKNITFNSTMADSNSPKTRNSSKVNDHHSSSSAKSSSKKTAKRKLTLQLTSILIQIMLIDIIFSLDSVITAVGMASNIEVMIIAILLSVVVMIFLSEHINNFINKHPTIKMLALSFLVLIGIALIADGISFHIPKAYIYFAMAFSVIVEMLNIRVRTLDKT